MWEADRSGGSEAQGVAEIVESAINGAECRFDGAGMLAARGPSAGWCGEDRSEQTSTDLDQQRAEPHAICGEPIAPAGTDALGQRVSTELAQITTELTEGVGLLGETMARPARVRAAP